MQYRYPKYSIAAAPWDDDANIPSFGWGPPMTIRGHSNFEARQLVLFGAAAIVLLVFVWIFFH